MFELPMPKPMSKPMCTATTSATGVSVGCGQWACDKPRPNPHARLGRPAPPSGSFSCFPFFVKVLEVEEGGHTKSY